MTNREFYEQVKEANISEELTQFAQEQLDKLDASNENRRIVNAKKALEREAERAPIREAIMACMSSEPKTATTLINEAGVELKPQAIPSLLKGLIADGKVEKVTVKVKGKGNQVGYILA